MANGLLGKASPAANAATTVYQVPAAGVTSATVNINIVNTAATATQIRLAVAAAAAPAADEWIEYDFTLPSGEVMERTGFVLSPSERVVVVSSIAGTSVRVHGFEK